MQTSPPLLAPLLRSETQGRLLAQTYLNPDLERTITDLAARADTSVANASRELNRLVSSGYLSARTSGRNRYIRANQDHPLFQPVAQILMYAYGPMAVLPPVLAMVPGVDDAYIYGSWATRLAGEMGPDPHDIDVLVVGDDIDLDALTAATDDARRTLGRDVNARAVSPETWVSAQDVFHKHIRERPHVRLSLRE